MIKISLVPFACATCFGDPNSLSSKGLMSAIFLLGAVIAFVLGCIAWTAFVWTQRAKKLAFVGDGLKPSPTAS